MSKKIIGHDTQLNLLQKGLNNARGHQSFLFSGPESVGKYTVARSFADNLVKGNDDCEWKICNNIDADINIITPERKEKGNKIVIKDISVEQVIGATHFLSLSPDKKARVLIIDEAHRMTNTAQNALLKTLEEPLKDRYIVIVTNSAQSILQTLHSRCLHIRFNNVEDEILCHMYDSDKYIDDIDGRPGYLDQMHTDEEFRENVEYARVQLQSFFTKKTYERMQLASDLSLKNDEYIQIFLQVWVYRIRNAAHKVQKFTLISVANRVEEVLSRLQSTNVNKKLILEDLFIHMM